MTTLQKQKIQQMREEGLSYLQISSALGVSKNTVKSYCKRNNLGGAVAVSVNNNTAEQQFCKNCGVPLLKKQGLKPKKFCCNKCRTLWWNGHLDSVNKKAVYSLVCVHCGKTFESYGNKNRRFCCHPCYIYERFRKAQGKKARG